MTTAPTPDVVRGAVRALVLAKVELDVLASAGVIESGSGLPILAVAEQVNDALRSLAPSEQWWAEQPAPAGEVRCTTCDLIVGAGCACSSTPVRRPAARDVGVVFTASYDGPCAGGDRIDAGDQVRYVDGELFHEDCADE